VALKCRRRIQPAVLALNCALLNAGSFAQTVELPDAPSVIAQSAGRPAQDSETQEPQSAQQTEPAQQNPNRMQAGMKNSVEFFKLLQERSLVFPDLATSTTTFGTWDKFKLAANNSVALSTVVGVAIGAGFGQAIDSPSGYGQGASGYGKRFGANLARAASNHMFGTFLLSSVLHEDPRFFVRRDLSFKQSLKYAAVRLVKTRSDSGEEVTNFSGLLGPMAAEALADTYYPEDNRGIGHILIRYASDQGWKFGGNLIRQYWPTINRKLKLVPPAN
jgi:hypothetical protein